MRSPSRHGSAARLPLASLLALVAVAAIAALVSGTTGPVAPVLAVEVAETTASEESVSWAVSPADTSGADGRPWIEAELDPGSIANEHLAVRNLGDSEVTFSLSAADGYFTPTGRFNMLPSDATSVAAGTWIAVQDTVTVAAGGTAVVPFVVQVPDDATPGDYAAGIAASIYTEGTGDGATVGVESRVGFRVMTRVSGTLQPAVDAAIDGSYATSWNPFEPGTLVLDYTLENTGNARLSVSGYTTVDGGRLPTADTENARPIELLPGDRRAVAIRVPDVWPIGPITVPVTIERTMLTPSGPTERLESIVREVTVWAIPWPQLIILGAITLLLSGLFWGRRRRAKQLGQLIESAREAGRREALGGADIPPVDATTRG